MGTIAERLDARRKELDIDIQTLQKRVEALALETDERAKGISYSSVHGYVTGAQADPPLPFLRLAARVLRVDPAWLTFGVGPKHSDEEEMQEAVGEVLIPALDPMFRTLDLGGGGVRGLFDALLRSIIQARPEDDPEPSQETITRLGGSLLTHVSVTLLHFAENGVPEWKMHRQFTTILNALLQVVPGPGQGQPLNQILYYLSSGEHGGPTDTEEEDPDATS